MKEVSIFGPDHKILDVTHTIFHNMPVYWTEELFTMSLIRNIPKDKYEARLLSLETHHGTHIDAPRHIIEEGKTIDEYSFVKLAGDFVCLNLQYKQSKGVPREITASDLEKYESDIKDAEVILLNTGSSKIRSLKFEYMFNWPYLDLDGARYITSNFKRLKIVGTDAPSIAANLRTYGDANVIETHKELLSKDILIPEELNFNYPELDSTLTYGFFIFLPLKIAQGDGAPGRAFIIL